MSINLTRWDSVEYLKTEEDDPSFIIHAFSVIARAKNINQLTKNTGLTKEMLHQTLSPNNDPTFTTVARALGFKLSVQQLAT